MPTLAVASTTVTHAQPVIGVLALQGDVHEHLVMLADSGVVARPVRRPEELEGLHGIVIPGGESTTIDKLSRIFEVREPLVEALQDGLPAFGSCAGMILLADRVLDGRDDQQTFGGLDITVRRNAFGRQVDSFETDIEMTGVDGAPVHAVFIRAPWVEQAGAGVEVLGRVVGGAADGKVVAVRQGNVVATSFHPELADDLRVHQLFLGGL